MPSRQSTLLPHNGPDERYIPERSTDTARTLVMLFDGTGDKEDSDVTNVVLLRDMLYGYANDTLNTDKQLVYYQQGIGTYSPHFKDTNITIPLVTSASRTLDSAIAWSLSSHVTDAYRWLVEHYQPGDKISLFGFSRGAYTARAVAGMLNAVALLPLKNIGKADAAYNLFNKPVPKDRFRDDPISKKAWEDLLAEFTKFKRDNECTTVFIDFLGCWDAVNSVGLIRPIRLRFTANNDIVRVFRHALALDEHRVRFKPNLWGKPKAKGALGTAARVKTDVEEVWFAGVHTDVGGGSVPNDTRPCLAHIPFRWMIRELFKANTGIMLSTTGIQTMAINPAHLYPKVLIPRPPPLLPQSSNDATIPPPQTTSWGAWLYSFIPFTSTPPPKGLSLLHPEVTEEQQDLLDCLAPSYDQLHLAPKIWQPLEYAFLTTEVFNEKAVYPELQYKEERKQHFGVGRTVPPAASSHGNKIKIHRTVKVRMQAIEQSGERKGKTYFPRARVGYEKSEFATAATEAADAFEWVD